MDAKPQRPLRALNLGDENEKVSSAPVKTIHRRNQSSPVLFTANQQSQIANYLVAPHRAALTNLSNTARPVKAYGAQDDLALGGKPVKDGKKVEVFSTAKPGLMSAAPVRPTQQRRTTVVGHHKMSSEIPTSVSSLQSSKNVDKTMAKSSGMSNAFSSFVGNVVLQQKPVKVNASEDAGASMAGLKSQKIVDKNAKSTDTLKRADDVAISEEMEDSLRQILNASIVTEQKHSEDATEQDSVAGTDDFPSVEELEVEEPSESDDELAVTALTNQPQVTLLPQHHSYHPGPPVSNEEHIKQLLLIEEFANADLIAHDEEMAKSAMGAAGSVTQGADSEPTLSLVPYGAEYVEEDYEYYTTRSHGENTTGGHTMLFQVKQSALIDREIAAAAKFVETHRCEEDQYDEFMDTSMVAEYSEEIFAYMRTLEERLRPNPFYMENQTEIQWSMRAVLMDWVVQVHLRFNLLPETLFLSVNYVDRFLTEKVVSLGKLQLVGATALFIASKFEEIHCPSVAEMNYMVDGGYTEEEILKAERFMLSLLQFEMSWPGPMSFLRRISKADDYDLETRTLAKYFLEVTIMDERFVSCVPSLTAAASHCLARLMLRKGDWSQAHVHYSQYTYTQLRPMVSTILDCCENADGHHQAVFEKYSTDRYRRCSLFVEGCIKKGFRLPLAGKALTSGFAV